MAAGEAALLQGRVGQQINGGVQAGGLRLGGGSPGTNFLLGLGVVKRWDSHADDRMWRQGRDAHADLGERSSPWYVRAKRSFRQR